MCFDAWCAEDIPYTAGVMRPLEVIAPLGSVVNAQPPAAMAAGNVETSQRITDVVLGALAQAAPQLIPAASSGTMNNVTFRRHGPCARPSLRLLRNYRRRHGRFRCRPTARAPLIRT